MTFFCFHVSISRVWEAKVSSFPHFYVSFLYLFYVNATFSSSCVSSYHLHLSPSIMMFTCNFTCRWDDKNYFFSLIASSTSTRIHPWSDIEFQTFFFLLSAVRRWLRRNLLRKAEVEWKYSISSPYFQSHCMLLDCITIASDEAKAEQTDEDYLCRCELCAQKVGGKSLSELEQCRED